jgi:hypothetical protein
MKPTTFSYRRAVYISAAVVLAVAAVVPAMLFGKAQAGTPVSRKITMDNSAPTATDVTYQLSFTTDQGGSSANIGGMVIDFCTETPLIGDTNCTPPVGFSTNEGGLALANQVGITDWTIDASTSSNKLVLARTAASVNSAVNVSIDFGTAAAADGITNPTAGNTSFYARVLTFATTTGAQEYTSADPDNAGANVIVDYGGIALSTANSLTITAKVMEKLTFCVYTNANCGAGGTSVVLGDTTNGVLDEAQPYNNTDAKFDIKTNAQGGAVIRAKTFATPGHTLTSGSNTITAIGGTAAASNDGTEQFGFCVVAASPIVVTSPYTGVEGGAGTCASDPTTGTYDQVANVTRFALDTAVTGATFGDDIANTAADPLDNTSGYLNFLGNVSVTTEAGIYTTQMALIATGTF